MSDTSMTTNAEKQYLKFDNGSMIEFKGQLFSEASWFDEDTHKITRQRIYSLETGAQVYSIAEGDGEHHSHRGYQLESQDSILNISDGKAHLHLSQAMFLLFTQCILDSVEANSSYVMEHIEEVLRAANS